MTVKLLTEQHLEFFYLWYLLIMLTVFPSLKGGCTGSYESTLVKILHCWKSHVAAQITIYGPWHDILVLHITQARKPPLSHDLQVSFADNLGKQIGPRSGPTKGQA